MEKISQPAFQIAIIQQSIKDGTAKIDKRILVAHILIGDKGSGKSTIQNIILGNKIMVVKQKKEFIM